MALLTILEELGLLAQETSVDDLDFDFKKDGSYTRFNALQNGTGEYMVFIEKAGYNWIVFAEDNEPEDLAAAGIPSIHKTLRDAKRAAIEFARWFQECSWDMEREGDEDW